MLPKLCQQILKSCAHGLAESKHGLGNSTYDHYRIARSPQLVQKYVVQSTSPHAGKWALVVDAAAKLIRPLPALRKVLENWEQCGPEQRMVTVNAVRN